MRARHFFSENIKILGKIHNFLNFWSWTKIIIFLEILSVNLPLNGHFYKI